MSGETQVYSPVVKVNLVAFH